MFFVFYMLSILTGIMFSIMNRHKSFSSELQLFLLINRTLELGMQVTVLFHMMRYFTDYIVRLRKKVVKVCVVCCIVAYSCYFVLCLYGYIKKFAPEWFNLSESIYIVSNIMISVLCLLACNHIIWKLKMVYQDVCCSIRLVIAKNIALIITNTFLLLVILCIRILLSALMIWSTLDPIFTLSALILFPIGSNVILLVLIKDYSTHSSSTANEDSIYTRFLDRVGLSPRFHYIIDTIGQIEDNPIYQSDLNFYTEPHLKYKYDDTLSSRSVGASSQPNQSLRSIFDSVIPRSADGEASSEEDGTKSDRSNSIALSIRSVSLNCQSDPSLTRPLLENAHAELSQSSTSMTHEEPELTERTTESPVESPDAATDISIQDRCGRSLPCSISLAVFVRLSNTYKLFGRYQSVFVRCSYQYHARGGLRNDWREAGETEVTPILPCEKGYLFNCCIVIPLPLGVSDGGSLSPTGRLQRFLTERSAGRGERGALRDITLQFECIGTNESNSRVYMKNKYNKVLFAESLSLNSLLQLPSMRYCIRRNGQLSDTPFLSTGGSFEHASEPSPSSFPKRASQRDFAGRSVDDSHVEEELSAQSTSPEQSTSFDLYSSMPVGSLDFRNLQTLREKRKEKYTLGVFLMTVRPRVEGRFFVKEFVFDSSGHNGRVLFGCDPPEPGKTSLAHVMESMNETDTAFDMPSAYCRYAQSLWNHETEDLRRLHSQQKNIANFQLRHHEFQTMDDLLIRSRDFINSQHFYESCLDKLEVHKRRLESNQHADRKVHNFTFKPSTMKKVEECALIPTNLHINELFVSPRYIMEGSFEAIFESLLPQPIPYFSVLSCGTPNAYALGFSEGGLFDLLLQLKGLRDRRVPCPEADAEKPAKVSLLDKNRTLGIRIRERFDLSTSQAIAILAASFINDLTTLLRSCQSRFWDMPTFVQWRRHGYPMMYLSLLSMYNKEKAMILDTFVSVYCLRSVVFKLTLKRRGKLEVSYKPDFKVEGGKLVIPIIVTALPQHLHMTEFDFINTSRLHSLTIHVIPFFASIGVDVNQTISDLISQQNITMENNINRLCFRDLLLYEVQLLSKDRLRPLSIALYNAPDSPAGTTIHMPRFFQYIFKNYDCSQTLDLDAINAQFPAVSEELRSVKRMLESKVLKNVDLILAFLDLAKKFHAGITVMCKSGKDRTGMLVSLSEVRAMGFANIIGNDSIQWYLDLIRGYGTRIMNAEKNTGKAQYMFNALQDKFLPDLLKAPRYNRGHGIT